MPTWLLRLACATMRHAPVALPTAQGWVVYCRRCELVLGLMGSV